MGFQIMPSITRPIARVKRTDTIKPLWAFFIILGTFPVTGAICGIYYHSAPMFYASLVAVPLAAITFPMALFLLNVLPLLVIRTVYSIVQRIWRSFS